MNWFLCFQYALVPVSPQTPPWPCPPLGLTQTTSLHLPDSRREGWQKRPDALARLARPPHVPVGTRHPSLGKALWANADGGGSPVVTARGPVCGRSPHCRNHRHNLTSGQVLHVRRISAKGLKVTRGHVDTTEVGKLRTALILSRNINTEQFTAACRGSMATWGRGQGQVKTHIWVRDGVLSLDRVGLGRETLSAGGGALPGSTAGSGVARACEQAPPHVHPHLPMASSLASAPPLARATTGHMSQGAAPHFLQGLQDAGTGQVSREGGTQLLTPMPLVS